jgi:hypothetical protein
MFEAMRPALCKEVVDLVVVLSLGAGDATLLVVVAPVLSAVDVAVSGRGHSLSGPIL